VKTQPQRPLNVSIIDTESEFRALRETWNALANAAGGSVFLQHEWFDAAWSWRRQDSSLFVMIASDQNAPVGIFPLIRVTDNKRIPAIRRLEFLTVPDTQLCDVIAAPEDQMRVVEAFCVALHHRSRSWDRMVLRYVDQTATALRHVKTAFSAGNYDCDIATESRNLFVGLDTTWDAFYNTRTRSLKKANNLAANRLKKIGSITVEHITSANADPNKIQSGLKHAIEISGRSWKQSTGNSLDHRGPLAFIEALTGHAARRGWLSIWLLSIDGKPLAMEYQLVDAANVYALRADFDAECEEVSPGSHLMRTLLESLFGKNLHRYYMGPGENPYKTRWTEQGDPVYQITVHGRTWRGHLARLVDDVLKPRARAIRTALRFRMDRQVRKPAGKSSN